MVKCPQSVTVYGNRWLKESLSARILGDMIAVDAKQTVLNETRLIQMRYTPASLRKFCEDGLRMCRKMEGK